MISRIKLYQYELINHIRYVVITAVDEDSFFPQLSLEINLLFLFCLTTDLLSLFIMSGKRTFDDLSNSSDLDGNDVKHGEQLTHVTEACVREDKRTKRCQSVFRLQEYLKNYPTEHTGLNARTGFFDIQYAVWDDNSDSGLIGKFMYWLAKLTIWVIEVLFLGIVLCSLVGMTIFCKYMSY